MGHLPGSSVVSLLSILSLLRGGFSRIHGLSLSLVRFFSLSFTGWTVLIEFPLRPVSEMVGASGSHVPRLSTIPTKGIRVVIPFGFGRVSLTSSSLSLVPLFVSDVDIVWPSA